MLLPQLLALLHLPVAKADVMLHLLYVLLLLHMLRNRT